MAPAHDDNADTPDRTRLTGPRVRAMRLSRQMSLRTLAARSGIDPSTLSRIERGLADTTVTVLSRLARGLGCTAEALMNPGLPTTAEPEVLGDLQRSLIGTTLEEPATGHNVTWSVAERIAAVREYRGLLKYRSAVQEAARCLPAAHVAAVRGGDVREARIRLVHLCFDAALCARILGDIGTAWIAADRCRNAAIMSRRPALKAASTFILSYVALGRSVPSRAAQIAVPATELVRPDTPELAALLGYLHLVAALALSRAHGDAAARDRHIRAAEALLPAAREDTDPFALRFGPESVWQWRMNIALENRDTTGAVEALSHIRLEHIPEPDRQAVYFVGLGRIYLATGHTDSARRMLERADMIAREYVRHHRAAQLLRDHLDGMAGTPSTGAFLSVGAA